MNFRKRKKSTLFFIGFTVVWLSALLWIDVMMTEAIGFFLFWYTAAAGGLVYFITIEVFLFKVAVKKYHQSSRILSWQSIIFLGMLTLPLWGIWYAFTH